MKTNRLKTAFKKLIDTIKEATSRFPYAIALGVSTAVTMIVFIHLEEAITQAQSEWFQRAAMTLIMGVPIALSIKMIEELFEKQSRWIIHVLRILGLALLTIYFFFGLPHFEMVYIVRYIGFNIFLWGMFLTIPFFKRRELIEVFTFKVGWRLLITGFYCAIIFGGVSGILFSLKELLDVPITSEHYQDAIFIIAGIILPTFFFVGIPKKEDVLPSKLTKFFRILLIYVIMPILTAYTVVLYLYFVKMLFEQALPKNIISNLVLWYSIIGIVILYLARPETNKSRWAKLFDRWFLRLLYIPLAMMFISVFIRVNQYGITEPRYYVIIGGVWILAMTTYIMLKNPKKRKNVIIPLSAAVLALLTVIGP